MSLRSPQNLRIRKEGADSSCLHCRGSQPTRGRARAMALRKRERGIFKGVHDDA